MPNNEPLQIKLVPYNEIPSGSTYDLNQIIYDLDCQIDLLSSHADQLDYLISVASGLLCGALDILWVGDFSLEQGRAFASDKIDGFVKKTAKIFGCKSDDLGSAVQFLEQKFPLPSDGNMSDFGGARQHHLRDFAHHPTAIGLIFSLLTQFTGKSFGTDVHGNFLVADISSKSMAYIGSDVPGKIVKGTFYWFFHLVSDMAGSSRTAGLSGGMGIPGPLLALAKELSALPIFKSIHAGEVPLSKFLSKLFNGTLLQKDDGTGLRFDFRSELGILTELGRQAVPVIANECIVRGFYFIRRFAMELKAHSVRSLEDIKQLNWEAVKPVDNPTIDRMITVASGVFAAVDVGEAVITQKYWVSVNYVGVGRFALAIHKDVIWCLKGRHVKKIKQMYEDIKRFAYTQEDGRVYERLGADAGMEQFELTAAQVEILYNLEYHKTFHDAWGTKLPIDTEGVRKLKLDWLNEWRTYIGNGFSSFLESDGAEIHWYSEEELLKKIEESEPEGVWFRLVLLEAMLFEPYYPLSLEQDKKGNDIPSKKYQKLQNVVCEYGRKQAGDSYLEMMFSEYDYYQAGYVKRLRKCYEKVLRELNEVLKTALTSLAITAGVAIAVIVAAGAFAPAIAVALVGSNFAGLSGAALTSACLAYLGGGAIAVGGAGMAGGTMVIVGGGAILGVGMGAGVGGAVGAINLGGKRNVILQSAKLLVSIREVFLNDEHNIEYSDTIREKYVQNILKLENELSKLRLKADVASGKEKKKIADEIKGLEDSIDAMKIARKSLEKFVSSFKIGMEQE